MAFFAGDQASTHISTLSGGFRVSQKEQVLSGVRYSVFTANDRWFVQGDNRFSWTSQNTYGLGADTIAAGAENVKYNFFRVAETTYRSVRRGLFVGGGLDRECPQRHPPRRGCAGRLGSIRLREVQPGAWILDRRSDVERREHRGDLRYARQCDQCAARLVRERGGADLLRWFSRRRFVLAATVSRRPHVPQAHRRRPPSPRLLDDERSRPQRIGAVLRSAVDGQRRSLGARLRRRPLQGRAAGLRRSGVSWGADAERSGGAGRCSRTRPPSGAPKAGCACSNRGRRPAASGSACC